MSARRCVDFTGVAECKVEAVEGVYNSQPIGILYQTDKGERYVIDLWGRAVWLKDWTTANPTTAPEAES